MGKPSPFPSANWMMVQSPREGMHCHHTGHRLLSLTTVTDTPNLAPHSEPRPNPQVPGAQRPPPAPQPLSPHPVPAILETVPGRGRVTGSGTLEGTLLVNLADDVGFCAWKTQEVLWGNCYGNRKI